MIAAMNEADCERAGQVAGAKARVIVIGAGAAGLMAAIGAGRSGARVLVCEQLARAGVKLLATGGGRCNLTNTLGDEELMAAFGRSGRFMQPAMAAMGPNQLREMLAERGVQTHEPDGLHVYPVSNSAASVQKALVALCEEVGAEISFGAEVRSLRIEGGDVSGVETAGGEIVGERVVVATGGRGYPRLGATGTGYELARQAGHTIVEPTPALVPLVASDNWLGGCAGVSLPGVRVWAEAAGRGRVERVGDVLITHEGLSGPAILDLSGDVAVLLRKAGRVTVRADVTGVSAEQWRKRFDEWQSQDGHRLVRKLVGTIVPGSLAEAICRRAGIGQQQKAAQFGRAEREALAELLSGLPVEISGTATWDDAIVTRGGVSLKQINPHTLESKLVRGLYFAGEVVDLDGPCGGFNLTWAFASGYLAGTAAGGSQV